MIVIISVRHTGTRFVRSHLIDCKYMNRHVGERYLHQVEPYIDNNLVIPLRRLDRIIVSWERRDMGLEGLRDSLNELIDKYDHRDPYYLPIDSDDRDEFLKALNEGMDTDFKTDWPVVDSDKNSSQSNYSDIINKEYANILISEFDQFFSRFYGRKEQDAAVN